MLHVPTSTDRLPELAAEIKALRRSRQDGRLKPHKLALLLAVLDLADHGLMKSNRIYFNEDLLSCFSSEMEVFGTDADWIQLAPPFFHLRNSSFWKHQIKTGRQDYYNALTTSGGGTRRITDNIEYSYLSEDAFSVISDDFSRMLLRRIISAELQAGFKLSTAFHESIKLSRSSLSRLLELTIPSNNESVLPGSMTFNNIRDETAIGSNYVKAMRRYMAGVGFLDRSDNPTHFSAVVAERDRTLSMTSTQWLMHYYLCTPHGRGPEFWRHLVLSLFKPDEVINGRLVSRELSTFLSKSSERTLAERTLVNTASVFLHSYADSTGLGGLSILTPSDATGAFLVGEPEDLDEPAFSYILADYWEGTWPELKTVNLDSIVSDSNGPAALMLLGVGQSTRLLRESQSAGYIELQRRAAPYQVVRLWDDSSELLERIYD